MKPVVVVAVGVLRRKEVLSRFSEYDRLRYAMHPNELNPLRFRRLLRESEVKGSVWVDGDILRSGASEWTAQLSQLPLVRWVVTILGKWPAKLLFGNDMYAFVQKYPR